MSVDIAVVSYLKHLIEREWKGGKGATLDEIADRVGVSKTQIVNIKGHSRGAGPDTIKGFAREFHGGSRDALYEAAKEYAAKHPSEVVTRVVDVDALNPKEAVRQTKLYRDASPRTQHAFDTRDPYTVGDKKRDFEFYTRKLLMWIDEDRMGVLDDDPYPDATPVPARPRKAKARKGAR